MFVEVKATTNPQIHLNKLGYNLSSLPDSVATESFAGILHQSVAFAGSYLLVSVVSASCGDYERSAEWTRNDLVLQWRFLYGND